ncbi:SIS domain-containing protein [Microbispora sp. CA-102843]|uniref:SIS domain-containing protein n=1 Tax=Microbispora sp. CA-102843 TaxID=3239952 RepID=UPI003D8B7719
MSHDISMSEALDRQPEALASAVRTLREQLTGSWPAPRRPLFVAMGASHAALAACVHQLRAYGIWASRAGYGEIPASIPAADVDLVAGVSQSGRSAETIDGLREVEAERRLAVVNIAQSPLAELAGTVLSCGSVPDSKVSTSGFTVTLAALGMLADTWALGAPADSWESLADHLDETARRAEDTVDVLVEGVADSVAVDVVGAGASLTAAEEGALMLREACRLPATAYETRQYLHGPMESAGRTAHLVIGDEREAALALQLAEAGHRVLYVGPCAASVPQVEVPRLAPMARAILENGVLQRLVAKVAAARNVPVGEFVFSMDDTKVDALTAETA